MSESYAEVHAKRFQKSLEWIQYYADKAERILDVGGGSPFTKTLMERWPGKLLPYFNNDLRAGFVVRDCDLILAMEVLEHVEDSEHDGVQADWRATGIHMVLTSCWMSLRPGGHLFVTTPNVCSITAIHHALNLEPPMIYQPHFRELAPYQLDEMVREVGFEIVRRETLDVWRNAISMREHAQIAKFIEEENYPMDLRGEDIFCLAKRPDGAKTAG